MFRSLLGLTLLFTCLPPIVSAMETNAHRLSRGLPPLSPRRRPSRVDAAPRQVPSAQPLSVSNGDFDSVDPVTGQAAGWTTLTEGATIVDDGSGSSYAVQLNIFSDSVNTPGISTTFNGLAPNTQYSVSYTTKIVGNNGGTGTCSLFVIANGTPQILASFAATNPIESTPVSHTFQFNTGDTETSSPATFRAFCDAGGTISISLQLDDFSIATA